MNNPVVGLTTWASTCRVVAIIKTLFCALLFGKEGSLAFEWHKIGAGKNDVVSLHELGKIYASGSPDDDGVPNHENAMKSFNKAIEQIESGKAPGQYNKIKAEILNDRGLLSYEEFQNFSTSRQVKTEREACFNKAYNDFQASSQLGNAKGKRYLGLLLLNKAINCDPQNAHAWRQKAHQLLRQAKNAGDPNAESDLIYMSLKGTVPGRNGYMEPNQKGLESLMSKAEQNDLYALLTLAHYYNDKKLPRSREVYLRKIIQTTRKLDPDERSYKATALRELGEMAQDNADILESGESAQGLFKQASALGDNLANARLGEIHQTRGNNAKAELYYQKAMKAMGPNSMVKARLEYLENPKKQRSEGAKVTFN